MSSMGDLGRQFERVESDPQPTHPQTDLENLERRLEAFLAWGQGRPDRDIRDRFQADFGQATLDDTHVEAINAGRTREVRPTLSRLAGGPPR
jgi:hypothetical protein